MNYGIIDIGSNSVRLLYNGKKYVTNTQLSEKAAPKGNLLPEAMKRTLDAVLAFADKVKAEKGTIKAFATEAARSAKNGSDFVAMLKEKGIECDVLSSEKEAKIGFVGAYYGDGIKAVLDVGGASSELIVGDREKIIYSHSLPLGSVRTKDLGALPPRLNEILAERVKEYGAVPPFSELICIGGTSSSILAIRDKVEPYDPEKIHLKKLYKRDINDIYEYLYSLPLEERKSVPGLHPKKIEVVPAGAVLISEIMSYLDIEDMTVSESDNLEGYLSYHT